jgi:HSP90 family molecular chaperone
LQFLPVAVDKSHLITIGERLYSESIELIRELVNNAYDADATDVWVTVSEEAILVEDNGTGMDLEGLRQYFLIGSQEKLQNPKSPRFGRDRIGQFGIGKFATLSACQRFEVVTRKGEFAARVIFDKEEWTRPGGEWRLPLETTPPDQARGDGTTVRLQHLTRRFDPPEVERRLYGGGAAQGPPFCCLPQWIKGSPKKPRRPSTPDS